VGDETFEISGHGGIRPASAEALPDHGRLHERTEVEVTSAGHAGTRRHGRDARNARETSDSVGGEDRRGFVSRIHDLDATGLGAHQDGRDVPAAQREEKPNALALEHLGDQIATVHADASRPSSTWRPGVKQVSSPRITTSAASSPRAVRSTSTSTWCFLPSTLRTRVTARNRSPTTTGRSKRRVALPSTTLGWLTASMAAWSARPNTNPPCTRS